MCQKKRGKKKGESPFRKKEKGGGGTMTGPVRKKESIGGENIGA